MKGGGVPPPLSVNFFPLTFWENVVRDGSERGGGTPLKTISVTGVFDPFPKYAKSVAINGMDVLRCACNLLVNPMLETFVQSKNEPKCDYQSCL